MLRSWKSSRRVLMGLTLASVMLLRVTEVGGGANVALAEERTAAEMLPPSVALYAEIRNPKSILELVLDHPLSHRVQETADYRKALESPDYLRFKAGVAIVEAQMELPWRKLVESLTAGGVYAAYDADSQGSALLVHASDAELPKKLLDTLLGLARADAAQKGQPDPVKTAEYRGVTAHETGDVKFAVVGQWIMACNKSPLGKGLIDRLLDGGDCLAKSPNFVAALSVANPARTGWAYADVARIRDAGVAKDLFRGPVDNPTAELLFGGIIANLQKTPYATLELQLEGHQQRLALLTPHDPSWIGEAREFFFGKDGQGLAPPAIPVPGMVLSLRTYRDIAGMWLCAGDLFNENINDEFAKADSQLATLFSGRDFGEDILGAIKPEIQLVVARQTFENNKVTPSIKLPSFALVSRLKDVESMQPELRRIFQSLIGFLNIVGAMEGQPQLEQDIEKEDGRQVISATYLADAGKSGAAAALGKINYNFSPSVAFVDDVFIVSSTRPLAHALAIAAKSANASTPRTDGPQDSERVNTEARLAYSTLLDVLHDNRGQLVAQNMLEKGHGKEQAEKEIDLLLELLQFIGDTKLRLSTGKQLRLELETSLVAPEK